MSRIRGTQPKLDRRVRRTRDQLGEALVELMHEKPYGAITVREVLERAAVGRSTFYTHFTGKDDLFLSDAEEFFAFLATHLSQSGEASRRVFPVREFFAHVSEMKRFFAALVASGKLEDLLQLAQGHFARGIERRLVELGALPARPSKRRTALAQAQAGAVLSLLRWWMHEGTPESPEAMDELFHRMAWAGVGPSTGVRRDPGPAAVPGRPRRASPHR